MDINNSNANSLKFNDSTTKSFNFGEKMLTHYIKNNLANTDPYGTNNSSTLKWYPWSGAINSSTSNASNYPNYTEQLYSRLISINPFDNTTIYASRPNKIENVNNSINKTIDAYSWYSSAEAKLLAFE